MLGFLFYSVHKHIMNLVSFFYPERTKAIIFIVLFLAANMPFLGTNLLSASAPMCITQPCPQCPPNCTFIHELSPIFWPMFLLSSDYSVFTISENEITLELMPILHMNYSSYIVPFILNMLYFYLLSCVIYWIFEKVTNI